MRKRERRHAAVVLADDGMMAEAGAVMAKDGRGSDLLCAATGGQRRCLQAAVACGRDCWLQVVVESLAVVMSGAAC